MPSRPLLQVVRIPLLLVLLALAVTAKPALLQSVTRLDLSAAWGPWLLLTVSGVAFAAVALVGRDSRHPPGLLAVEVLLAAVVGLVPPMAWLLWFGLRPLATFGAATGNMFVQALAIAWLAIAVTTAVRQARRHAAGPAGRHASTPAGTVG